MFKRKKWLVPALVLLVLLSLTAPALAVEIRNGDNVTIPAGALKGPLFVAGNEIVIDADVDGDVFAAGQTVIINGNVNGDLLAAARTIRINGEVGGDARCAAQDIDLKGELGQSLTAAASEVRQLDGSRVNRDALIFANQITVSGTVGRQYLGAGGTVRLNGAIGNDVNLWRVEDLRLGPAAVVGGNLYYGAPHEATVASGAQIAGTTKWEYLEPKTPTQRQHRGFNWLGALAWFAAGVLFWGVLTLISPGIWNLLSQNMRQSPGHSFGWGLLLLLITPLVILLLLITVIAIPLSLILMAAYLILLYAAKIIVGDFIGRLLAARFGWAGRVNSILPFLLGFALLLLLTSIPIVGLLMSIATVCLAMGAAFLAIYHWRQGGTQLEH
ncbi:polymer-forming cytoskeletal protein [Pelotomaculum isophthalicicum JI]|uniref:Polymer-forming cytoskeletal protein n=1 Tax=Pelotomaculum isophthalicicum JI TaxID=947010 RepID=A0A9X4H087_9FIRM|nr:polymer-forming cytoskeletal protein [Pelotomaculum isophthalicicum]MDF9409622.1 polymer-forming cytoskeletal protein [Pelotomaculum isophthalicicum JI]